jgi:hypothetical protein
MIDVDTFLTINCLRAYTYCISRPNFSHSIRFSGKGYHHSSKASGGEDWEVEQPVSCRYASAFHFHATLTRVLGPTLIRHEVVQVREPREKRLLAPAWVVKPFQRKQFPLEGMRGLSQQGAGDGHLRGGEDGIPARLFVLEPAPYAHAVGRPSRGGDVVGKVP